MELFSGKPYICHLKQAAKCRNQRQTAPRQTYLEHFPAKLGDERPRRHRRRRCRQRRVAAALLVEHVALRVHVDVLLQSEHRASNCILSGLPKGLASLWLPWLF